ncbi:MAG: hypothetical protein AMXMBFR23_02440 [Chloroflexota bacterium]
MAREGQMRQARIGEVDLRGRCEHPGRHTRRCALANPRTFGDGDAPPAMRERVGDGEADNATANDDGV